MIMSAGAMKEIIFLLPGLKKRRRRELPTTEMELKAIASPASSGFNTSPANAKIRAAIGIPMTL